MAPGHITEGYARRLAHRGPALPGWQRSVLGRLFSVVNVTEGWLVRLYEGEFFEWETAPVQPFHDQGDALVIWSMALGMGPNGYGPSGEFLLCLHDKPIVEFCSVKYSTLWRRENVRFYFEIKRKVAHPETAACGLGYLWLPAELLKTTGGPLRLSVRNRKRAHTWDVRAPFSERWCRIDGCTRLAPRVYLDDGIRLLREDPVRPAWKDRSLYVGDLHTHSGRTEELHARGEREFLREGIGLNCGIKSPDEVYRYGKFVSRLDFCAVTDHHGLYPPALTPDDWQHRIEAAARWNRSGFATFVACELMFAHAGHWNLYFREAAPAYPPSQKVGIARMKEVLKGRPDRLIFFPHQVPTYCLSPVDWDELDPDLTPLVEIYSCWGSGEYFGNPLQCVETDVRPASFVDAALQRGFRLGFIASSDAHEGAAGDATSPYNPIGAGLAFVWAPELTREAVFDALADRWCYATTGARMVLRFSVNGTAMGRDAPRSGKRRNILRLEVAAPDRLREIVIVRNGREAAVRSCRRSADAWEWVDEAPAAGGTNFYYPRIVMQDGETAWGSPVWVHPDTAGRSETDTPPAQPDSKEDP